VSGARVNGGAPGPTGRVRTLVVEDEAPARERLLELLGEVPWVEVVGVASDGAAAATALDALRPALVLLDVQLPECSGLEALERAAHRPAVVFTTAYDRHAVAAFALGAVDYLLKPFGRDRLVAALDRVRRTLLTAGAPADADAGPAADEPTPRERARLALGAGGWLERLFVRDRGRLVPVLLREVERLDAEDDYVALVVGGRRFLVELPLGEFAERLDPRLFVRIHRAHIVNLDFVRQLVPYDGARLQVEMRDGTKLLASRTRSRELRDLAV
jgi:two-component system LytT family response regulator